MPATLFLQAMVILQGFYESSQLLNSFFISKSNLPCFLISVFDSLSWFVQKNVLILKLIAEEQKSADKNNKTKLHMITTTSFTK